jgi:ABC-type transport system involved in multi-copper enzyme maturation permease subunit
MFGSIFSFEVRRLVRSVSTYIYFFILVVVTFFLALLAGGAFPEANFNFAGEKIFANSPIVIDAFFSAINNYIGLIIIVAVVGNAVLKDFRSNTYTMIFTTPVSKFDYLFGRFSASLLISLLILTGPAFGMMLGFASPWVNPDKIEAFMMAPYIHAYCQTVIPNAIVDGTIFFAVSLIARDIFVIWLSLIIFFVATGVSNSIFGTLETQTLAALVDPMGNYAKRTISKYWSTYDKNHLHYSLVGLFLVNRVIWMTVALIVWVIGYSYFSFTSSPRRLFLKKGKLQDSSKVTFVPSFLRKGALPKTHQSYTTGANLKNLWGLSVNECRTLLRNTYFRIILLFGMLFLFLVSLQIGKIYETTTFPVTYEIVEFFGGTFQLFIVVLTIMFAGELIWRSREYRMSNILDSLPVPNWVFYVSKASGLMFMQVILLAIIMVCGVVVQLFKGYTNFEILLYVKYLFGFKIIDMWLLAILALFVQSVVSNKYLGFFIAALFYFWNSTFALLVLKHNLFIFSSDPGVVYSDMNSFGHAVFPYFVFKIYWGAFAVVLAVLSSLLWTRGTEKSLKQRWQEAMSKANRPSWMVIIVGLVVFIGSGAFIYYNTNVLNKFQTDFQQEEEQATYEKKFKKYQGSPQPKITDVTVHVDLFPDQRRLHATGDYVLKNKSTYPIDSVHVLILPSVKVNSFIFSRQAKLALIDTEYTYRIYTLAQPLQPGDTITLSFNVDLVTHGFEHSFSGMSAPVYNGTFVNNQGFLPGIGYDDNLELADNSHRKKHGLGYRRTANPITDTTAYQRNVFTHDADFINFDATVSTVPDQIAVAPGYLQREWTENGRRYFHYKMDKPILNFYSFLSARYTVKKEKWNDISLEIYYHKGHEYDLDRMFNGMKKALSYYTANFSPYQHKQVRILEFPRYATFAQSFPNTIPFSEGIGFIADVDDSSKDNVDYPFYVTAHEVAHQWFAHQVIGADVEGSNSLSEMLAQYGAIMVMEKEYGEERLRKFLHIEMDKYLTARSNESEKEKPLAYVDPGQGYILYQKGGIMMHALNKYLGEDSLNHALKRFIERYAFNGPPYPTTLDLLASIRQSTPDSMQYFITDGFQKITMYDNKITAVKANKAGDKYVVDVTLESKKSYSDSTGKETDAPSENYIEIGVYKNRTTLMVLNRYRLKNGETKLSIPVNEKPYKVIIDPRLLLIDKKLDDNEMRLDGAEDKFSDKKEKGTTIKVSQ